MSQGNGIPVVGGFRREAARTYRVDLTGYELRAMNQLASHCARRSFEGMTNTGFEEHPDPLMVFAAEIGNREGLHLLHHAKTTAKDAPYFARGA